MIHRSGIGCGLALALGLGGAAAAQTLDNSAVVDQDGAENAAVIDQIGLGNSAGTDLLPLSQDGYYNSLTLRQTGTGNTIGTAGVGVLQRSLFGSPDRFNDARITQDGAHNRVDEVVQQTAGPAPGAGNRLVLEQAGGDHNTIRRVDQYQQAGMPGQSADVTMLGFGNHLDLLQQESASDLMAAENTIFALFEGDANGTAALRGHAGETGAIAGTLIQRRGTEDTGANGNQMQLEILGHATAFGILQRGRLNRTGAVIVTGDGNALGLAQDGTENDIVMSLIEGNDNEAGISQLGTNVAELALLGDSDANRVLIEQMGSSDARIAIEGNRNHAVTRQGYAAGLGGTNRAETVITGDDNLADLRQEGRNRFALTIAGSGNNTAGGFSVIAPPGMTAGSFVQEGFGNTATAGILGDANLAAFWQQGLDNAITLSVQGDRNEAILRQIGNGNAAGLIQNGEANVAVIQQ